MIDEYIKQKKKKEMIEKILNHSVNGESYFKTPAKIWKAVVLRKFNAVYKNEISVHDLIEILKKEGIEFTQNDKFIYYPVNELLVYIGKLSNKKY